MKNTIQILLILSILITYSCDNNKSHSTTNEVKDSYTNIQNSESQQAPLTQSDEFSFKMYYESDYDEYSNIIFHVKDRLRIRQEENPDHIFFANNEVLASMEGGSNPDFKYRYFFEISTKFMGSSYGKSYSDYQDCGDFSCEPETLIKEKDNFIKNQFIPGQVATDYKIHVVYGYYSFASDLRMEIMND